MLDDEDIDPLDIELGDWYDDCPLLNSIQLELVNDFELLRHGREDGFTTYKGTPIEAIVVLMDLKKIDEEHKLGWMTALYTLDCLLMDDEIDKQISKQSQNDKMKMDLKDHGSDDFDEVD